MRVSKMNVSNTDSKQRTVVLSLIMIALMMGSAFLIPLLRESEETVSTMYYFFAAVLAVGATVYAFLFERKISEGILFFVLPLAYVISLALLLLVDAPLLLPFWCFGGILLLCAFKIRYAALLNYYFLFLIGSTGSQVTKEALVMQVLCLLLLGFVMPLVKKWMDAVNVILSVLALLVSVRIVFFFTAKQEILNGDIFGIALVYVGIILVATLFSRMLQMNVVPKSQTESFDFLEELAASAELQDAELLVEMEAEPDGIEEKVVKILELERENGEKTVSSEQEATAFSPVTVAPMAGETVEERFGTESETELKETLSGLCDEESELLSKLSKEYPVAFLHARRVALFASEIAERLEGVNVLLVKAGGYYHEIGRVLGKNTLENTLLAAEAEEFPASLISVLREHTVNGDKPTTKEAALVFLTDNICSMCEYLKKSQGGKVLIEKVIDKALNLRITKGDLNASGLSIKEFSLIRNAMAEIIKEDMF